MFPELPLYYDNYCYTVNPWISVRNIVPVNFSIRACVSLKVKETDMVVVKKTKRDVMSTPHLNTK